MRFMEKEELRPFWDGKQSIAGMRSGALQSGFVETIEQGNNDLPIGIDVPEQPGELLLPIPGKVRVFFRYITTENGIILALDPFEAMEKYRLITGEMSNIFKGAPLAGINALFQLQFR